MLCSVAVHLGGKRHEVSLDWSDLEVQVARNEMFPRWAALYRVLYIVS